MTKLAPTFQIFQNPHVPRFFQTYSQEKRKIEAAKAAIKMVTTMEFHEYNNTSRQIPLPFIRQCLSALIKRNTTLSLRDIANLYKTRYDHTSIIRHIEAIEDLESIGNRDPKFKEWEQIKENFNLLTRWN